MALAFVGALKGDKPARYVIIGFVLNAAWFLALLVPVAASLVSAPDRGRAGRVAVSAQEMQLMTSYGTYMAKEHPLRRDLFGQLAVAVDLYSRTSEISKETMVKYLGDPDLFAAYQGTETFVYLYDRSDTSSRWAAYVQLTNGRITSVGYNAAAANDLSAYQPYSTYTNKGTAPPDPSPQPPGPSRADPEEPKDR